MNYSEMSDFEINKAVAFHIGLSTVIAAENLEFNPCNSWADAGPIIEKYRITMNAQFGGWFCFVSTAKTMSQLEEGNHHFSHMHDNPLRAAMIVFLMMQEQSNA